LEYFRREREYFHPLRRCLSYGPLLPAMLTCERPPRPTQVTAKVLTAACLRRLTEGDTAFILQGVRFKKSMETFDIYPYSLVALATSAKRPTMSPHEGK
jgi:hypothetical protein